MRGSPIFGEGIARLLDGVAQFRNEQHRPSPARLPRSTTGTPKDGGL